MDALNIGTKIENEGKNSQGMLSAEEFNELVIAVKALISNNVDGLQTKLTIISNKLTELENSSGTGGGAGSEEIAELRRLINELSENALTIGTAEGTAYDGGAGTALKQIVDGLADSALVLGTTAGTAYDGAAGATLEQIVKELVGGAGTMYSVYVKNNLDSLAFASQYGEECVLDFTFISQYRDSLDEPYKPTGELGLCTVMVKNSKYADFTVAKQMEVSSGVSIKLNIAEWLSSGINNIKITVKGGNTDKTTAPVTYTVQLTSLGVTAPNFAWWTAFAGDIIIPMMINGNISKTLHVTITGPDYNQSYDKVLGTAIYTDTPYNHVIPGPGVTGVYNVSFYLSNSDNTIQTKAVSVNIMCISATGEDVKLMCVNNVTDQLTNWQDNTVFDYSIYDGQSAATDAVFSVTREGDEVYASENDSIPTQAKQTLTYPMEIDTDDDADFEVVVSVTARLSSL